MLQEPKGLGYVCVDRPQRHGHDTSFIQPQHGGVARNDAVAQAVGTSECTNVEGIEVWTKCNTRDVRQVLRMLRSVIGPRCSFTLGVAIGGLAVGSCLFWLDCYVGVLLCQPDSASVKILGNVYGFRISCNCGCGTYRLSGLDCLDYASLTPCMHHAAYRNVSTVQSRL